MKSLSTIARVMLAGALALGMTTGVRAAEPAKDAGGKAGEVKFVMHKIGNFRSEACGVADFNNDGKLDIVAGPYLYLAPDFKPTKIRDLKGSVDEKGMGYYYDFMNEPLDVDGDGKIDVVACDWFQKACWWFRNPGPEKTGPWEENLMLQNGNYETAMLADVDGDGKAREVLPHVAQTVWYEFEKGADGKVKTVVHQISDKKMDFGVGAGDLNGDHRPDIIRPDAWFEAPEHPRSEKWIEHPFDLHIPQPNPKIAKHISMVLVHDVNGDGLNDLVYTMAHGYGICWMEQQPRHDRLAFRLVDARTNEVIGTDGQVKPGYGLPSNPENTSIPPGTKYLLPPGTEVLPAKIGKIDPATGKMDVHAYSLLVNWHAEMSGKDVKSATVKIDKNNVIDPVHIDLQFKDPGKFTAVTGANAGRQLAIVIDGVVRSTPIIKEKITAGRATITGGFTQQEAEDLCAILNSGNTQGEITFKRHMIDDTWTQAHAIALADLDGDGVKELITGKRFRAHNGNDPEEDKPLGVYYYKPVRQGAEVKWEKHVISYDQGVGAALNIVAVDLDGDGDLDIVVTGKFGGPVWFENKTK